MKKLALFLALVLVMSTTPAWAICGPIDDFVNDAASSDNYLGKAGGMLLKGVHDIVESPAPIIYNPYYELKNDPNYGLGLVKGLGTGVVSTLEHAAYGVGNILLAFCPNKGPVDSPNPLLAGGGGEAAAE